MGEGKEWVRVMARREWRKAREDRVEMGRAGT
jgi:hypothetical protein